jgi:hypothetical protein
VHSAPARWGRPLGFDLSAPRLALTCAIPAS